MSYLRNSNAQCLSYAMEWVDTAVVTLQARPLSIQFAHLEKHPQVEYGNDRNRWSYT